MLSSYAPALRRVRAALDIPSAGPRPPDLDGLKGVATPTLEVRNLSFSYRGAPAETLRDVIDHRFDALRRDLLRDDVRIARRIELADSDRAVHLIQDARRDG